MRISSKQYRDWSLEQWCQHVNTLQVETLSAWATVHRSSYNHAVTLGVQRDVARQLGWLPKLENGEMEILSDEDYAERFRAKHVNNVTDMWKSAQHWCEYLRREGRLTTVAAMLGIAYEVEFHPSDDINYYLERCQRVGDFKAWCFLDKNAVEAARKHGLLEQIKARAPQRPKLGYSTSGGHCHGLAELAVARLLEANGIAFVTQLSYPFTFPRGKRHRSKSDFYLTKEGAFVEVWSVPVTDTSFYWQSYLVRRQFKIDMCQRLNLRLLEIEARLMHAQGLDIYLRHIEAVFANGGIKLSTNLQPHDVIKPQYPTKMRGNGL